jgi:hypothetical protein
LLAQLVCDLRVGSGMSLLWWTTTLGMRGCSFSSIRVEEGAVWVEAGAKSLVW